MKKTGPLAPLEGTDAPAQPDPRADLSDPALYINRELAWLAFNERALSEALGARWPLLERGALPGARAHLRVRRARARALPPVVGRLDAAQPAPALADDSAAYDMNTEGRYARRACPEGHTPRSAQLDVLLGPPAPAPQVPVGSN